MMTDTWDSPIILTTMVQFLNTMFACKMSSVRRFHQLADSIIIIDEAQSIPIKCISMFSGMMNFLCHSAGSIGIICTATQPLFEKAKRRMIINGGILPNADYYTNQFRRNNIEIVKEKMNAEQLADFAMDHFCKNLLVIVNTKSAAKNLYDAVRSRTDAEAVLLTTNMCAQHRLDVIHEIKKKLKRNKKIICISTQLIEAGVDISFECVIRSLAGADSIIQSAGRCNRNGESSDAHVYVVDYADENLDMLKDIREAKEASQHVIDMGYDDFLKDDAIKAFYRQYFWQREKEMDYSSGISSLYDYLSLNSTAPRLGHYLHQAFQQAGKAFHVIDDRDTVPVVVRYGDSEKFINILLDHESLAGDAKNALKKLQRYTVECYKNVSECESIRKAVRNEETICYIADRDVYGRTGLEVR